MYLSQKEVEWEQTGKSDERGTESVRAEEKSSMPIQDDV